MSQENVDTFKRAARRVQPPRCRGAADGDSRPRGRVALGDRWCRSEGNATVYRGHEGVREPLRELDEALGRVPASSFRRFGTSANRIVAIGRVRTRGKESGVADRVALRVPWSTFKNGKAIRVRTYLDPKEALEAAGLSE